MIIYTDGAHSSKTNIGGWAYVLVTGETSEQHAYGSEYNTTNNRMELTALLRAMQYVDNLPNADELNHIYTDSAYIANCFAEKWYKKWRENGWVSASRTPVKNKDLWEQILELYETGSFIIEKVNGHSDVLYNNLADKYAVYAREHPDKEEKIK